MTTIFDLALEDFTNEVIDTQPVAAAPGMEDDWCEQTYFYDESVRVKSNRIETLQQRMLSEQFAESCERDRRRYRMTFPIFLTGAILGFVASIACSVLWVVGEYSRLATGFWFVVSWALIYFCLRRVWRA